MTLTNEDVKKLCEPLPLVGGHSVKVKAEAKPEAQKQWALWLVYTEEGPITERLDGVDPNWEFKITDKWAEGNSATVYARLTVCGVSRDCVGSGSNPNAGDGQKGAATDALKRGARLFGVGRYLLDAPQFYTDWEVKKRGNEWVRTRKQEAKWEAEANNKFAAWYRETFGSNKQSSPRQDTPAIDDIINANEGDLTRTELDDLDAVTWTRLESTRDRLAKLRNKASVYWANETGQDMNYKHVYNRIAIIIGSEQRPTSFQAFCDMMRDDCQLSPDAVWDGVEGYEDAQANEG